MIKQRHAELDSGRTLPLRSGKLSAGYPNTLALRNHIWFTPEAVIFDALNFLAGLILLWKIIKRATPSFTLRLAALVALFVVAVGYQQQPNMVVAESYKHAVEKPIGLQITTRIAAAETPIFNWPVTKSYISCYFSFYHQGIDIPTTYGNPVRPTSNGKVVSAGWDGGFGNIVVVSHKNGYISKYAHLSGVHVARGRTVTRGTVLGWIGTTGFATGPHLHFEVHKDGRPINPLNLLP